MKWTNLESLDNLLLLLMILLIASNTNILEDLVVRFSSISLLNFLVEKVAEFASDFVNKKLKPYIKSEPVPAASDDAVKVVVGETWNDIVM